MFPNYVIAFISRKKGLPSWFKNEYIDTMLGLHDQYKHIDYIASKAKSILNEEGKAEVDRLMNEFNQAVKQADSIAIIAYHCVKEKREMNDEEKIIVYQYILDNKEIAKSILNSK